MFIVSNAARLILLMLIVTLVEGCSRTGTGLMGSSVATAGSALSTGGSAQSQLRPAFALLPTQPPRTSDMAWQSSAAPLSAQRPSAPSQDPGELKVMTFNLRVATALDILNTWALRRGMVVDRIREFDPDLLGTQEGLRGQISFLRRQLDEYTFFGAGRSDGKNRGEMCGIFYRTSRFERLDGGHFWLSENPAKPGSKAWGAWFPRMVTWVKLQPRSGGEAIFFFNTHLDAFASRARAEGARLLAERMNRIAGRSPCIVTGDFNTDAGSEPYLTLTRRGGHGEYPLQDAFRLANPVEARGEGTRHSFRGGRGGDRIDWILASPSFEVLSSAIDHSRGVLGYPSDHFPVTATLRPAGAAESAMVQIE